MKVINLTDHDVNICDEYGDIIKTYKPSGVEARVRHYWDEVDYIDDIPVVVRANEHVVGLPRPTAGCMFIVSNIVLEFCTDRTDLLAPVQQVWCNGRVVGCRALATNRRES